MNVVGGVRVKVASVVVALLALALLGGKGSVNDGTEGSDLLAESRELVDDGGNLARRAGLVVAPVVIKVELWTG